MNDVEQCTFPVGDCLCRDAQDKLVAYWRDRALDAEANLREANRQADAWAQRFPENCKWPFPTRLNDEDDGHHD